MVDITPFQGRLRATKISYASDNPRTDFLEHLAIEGYTPPKILRDGVIDRIDDPTDKKGKFSGWYIFNQYENIAVASYGSWKDDSKHTWISKNNLSFAERIKLNDTIKEQSEKQKAEKIEQNQQAAREAYDLYSKIEPATSSNPYLKRKGVKPCDGLKQDGEVLIMPILDDGVMTSYQKIYPDGQKRMKTGGRKKGCSFTIDGKDNVIYIAEGLATGLSIHEATGSMVYIAIDCGNLYEVSQVVKRKHPESHIILAGENNNANRSKCSQIDLPAIFPPDPSHDDFNDMHVAVGIKAVKDFLKPEVKASIKETGESIPQQFRFGGVIDEIVDYYHATSINDQPLFAVQAAFAACSVMLGRNFITDRSNMTSIYMLNLGKSGTGKEHAKKTIEKILEATENEHLIGGDGYTSGAAVISALQVRPRHIAIIDEFSKSIEASNNQSGGHHLKEANAKLMEAFGRQNGSLRARSYATIGMTESKKKEMADQAVLYPSLTLLAMSTPDDFFKNIGEIAVKDGFINRFIICISDAKRTGLVFKSPLDVPESIINWDLKIKERTGNPKEFATEKPNPKMLAFTKEALDLHVEHRAKCDNEAENLEEFGLDPVVLRATEISMRLALIIALSENPYAEKIEIHHSQAAIGWIDFNLKKSINTLKMSISGSDYEASKKEILAALRNRKITRSDMHKRAPFSKYKSRDLNEILQALYESGLASNETEQTKGRAKNIWTAI